MKDLERELSVLQQKIADMEDRQLAVEFFLARHIAQCDFEHRQHAAELLQTVSTMISAPGANLTEGQRRAIRELDRLICSHAGDQALAELKELEGLQRSVRSAGEADR